MTTVTRNVIANVAGAGVAGVAGLAAAPLLIRWLGVESYGLVGFQLTLQTLASLFDFGLSVAITRELALLSAMPERARHIRSVVRTALVLYTAVGLLIVAAVASGAGVIASRWLASDTVPHDVIVHVLRIMSVTIGVQFVSALFGAAFIGLQRQVAYNLLVITGVLLRVGGGAAVAYLTHDIRLFVMWQAGAMIMQLVLMALALHRVLPAREGDTRFDFALLGGAWKLARRLAVISVVATIVVQADKLAVSYVLPLRSFGFYAVATLLAVTAAGGAGPIATAIFPRFAQLIGLRDAEELTLAYHRAAQAAAVIVLPAACVIAVFSREVLFVWTGSREIAAAVWPVAAILAIGTAMNGMVHVPYSLQLAHGWTKPTILVNLTALATFAPAMVFATRRYGIIGPAVLFAIMNGVSLCVGVLVTRWRLFPATSRGSFLRDIGPPLFAAAAVASVARLLMPGDLARVPAALTLLVTGLAALSAAAAAAPVTRQWFRTLSGRQRSSGRPHG